jgi:hypothetical protein
MYVIEESFEASAPPLGMFPGNVRKKMRKSY